MTASRRWRRPTHLLTVAAIFVATAFVGVTRPPGLDDLGNTVFDGWERLEAEPFDPNLPVRVVAVDEASLAAHGQWPWPRSVLADLTTRLAQAGAAAIAYDFVFAEPDRVSLDRVVDTLPEGEEKAALARLVAGRPSNDERFAQAVAASPTVLGATMLTQATTAGRVSGGLAGLAKAGFAAAGDAPEPSLPRFSGVAAPLARLAAVAPGIGATNWLPDRDQVVRRIPLVVRDGEGKLPSLALEALRVAQGASTVLIRSTGAVGERGFGATAIEAIRVGDFTIATDGHGAVHPRHRRTAPQAWISAERVLAGTIERDEIAGRIVVVGPTAAGLGDTRATPIDPSVPGVELHAQTIEGVLSGRLLVRPDWAPGAEAVLALVLVVIVGLALPGLPPVASAGLATAVVAMLMGGSFLAFRSDLLFDGAFPAGAVIAMQLVGAVEVWRSEQQTRRSIHAAFGKYLSPAVVDRLAENPDRLELGGETRDVTVMFCDLRNFTTLSEGLDAAELTVFMNAYLTPATDAVLEAHGTVDKYIGDAMMAFWNAPLDDPDHPRHAVEAALAIRAGLVDFRRQRAEVDRAAGRAVKPIEIGIGLARGPCSVGNMGSIRRFDYSILGDTANLASRLEGVSKLYGVDLVATEEVRRAAPEFAWLELDRVQVKGRSAVTRLFTAVGDGEFAGGAVFAGWAEAHERLLAAWRDGRFEAAEGLARELAERVEAPWRRSYEIFAERIVRTIAEPPVGAWDGVRRLDQK